MNKSALWLLLSLSLMVGGGALASYTQTDGGAIRLENVRFDGPDGIAQNGRLYIPADATPTSPAPGILAIHGYMNSHETQANFAIEFARRGWVTLAVDQTGHGYSDPPVGANGYGGPPALEYLRSLDLVDPDRIGLEGHSMGGWAVQAAAAAMPDGYRAMVLEGSSVSWERANQRGPDALRNVAVVFSLHDEFSRSMWRSPLGVDVDQSAALKALFDTDEAVERGRVYGSIEDGTARIFHQPPIIHPADHHSEEAIGLAIAWFQQTLGGGTEMPSSDQIWKRREAGTFLSLLGLVPLLLVLGHLGLRTRWFEELEGTPHPSKAGRGLEWLIAAAVVMVLPVLTFFPFKNLPSKLGIAPNRFLPQGITNQVLAWTTLVALISAVLFLVWHRMAARRRGATLREYGLHWYGGRFWAKAGKSLLLAGLIVFAGHVACQLSGWIFLTDFRIWVFAVKPLSAARVAPAFVYFFPFALFFLVLSTVLHGQLRRPAWTLAQQLTLHMVLLTAGFIALLLVQYVPLLRGGTLFLPAEPLWTILAFQLVPIMAMVAIVDTVFFRRTGHVYLGAFTNAFLVTWIVVASQATHVAIG